MDDIAEQPQVEPVPTAAAAAPHVKSAPAGQLEAWFAEWFPENPPANHPVPYLSGAWHHAHDAFADLIKRIG